MAKNKIEIAVSGALAKDTAKNIQSQLNKIGENVSIKFKIDDSTVKDLQNTLSKITKTSGSGNTGFGKDLTVNIGQGNKAIDKRVLSIKTLNDAQGKAISQQTKYRTELNKTETVTMDLIKNQIKHSTVLDNTGIANEKLQATYEQTSRQLKKIKDSAKTTNTILKDFGGKELHKKADGLVQDLNKINVKQDMTQKEMKETVNKARDLQQALNNTSREAKSMGRNSLTMGKMIGTAIEKFSIWSAVTVLYYAAIRAIKDGIMTVVDLDTALVELNKVTNLTQTQLKGVAVQASGIGAEVARTRVEIVQATAEFAKMGYSAQKSLALAKEAAILINISDGITDISDASTIIVSMMKAFNIEASDSIQILDKINEVSNNYSVSSADISKGMQKVSATLAAQNNDMDESIALFTAAQEIIQDYSRASTGIRTISLRLTGVDENEEAIDGLTEKLQYAFDEYETGVKLLDDSTGEWNSTYDILLQLSKVWDTLTDKERSRITYLVAGTRQSDILNSLLSNRITLSKAYTTALQSEGSAMQENGIYMDSVVAKANQFVASVQDMWSNAINSDAIKFFIDAGTAIIKLIDGIGLLNFAFMTLMTTMVLMSKGVNNFIFKVLPQFITSVAAGKGAIKAFGIAFDVASIKAAAMQAVITFGLSFAITILIQALGQALKAFQDWMDRLDNSIEKTKSLKSDIDKLNEALGKTGEDTSTEGIDKVLKKQEENVLLLEKELEIKQKLLRLEQEKTARLLNEVIPAVKEYNEYTMAGNMQDIYALGNADDENNLVAAYNAVSTAIEDVQNKIENIDPDKMGVKTAENRLKSLTVTMAELQERQENYKLAMIDLSKEVSALPIDLLNDKLKTYLGAMADILFTQNELKDSTNKLNKEEEDTVTDVSKVSSTMKSLAKQYDEINDSQEMSTVKLIEMISTYPEFIDYLAQENSAKEAGLSLTKVLFEAEKQKSANIVRMKIQELDAERDITNAEEARLEMLVTRGKITSEEFDNLSGMTAELKGLYASLENILNVNLDDFVSDGGSGGASKKLSEYINKLVELNKLKHEYNILVKKDEIGKSVSYDEQISKIKEIQDELHRLNVVDGTTLDTLKTGTKEYDELLSTINTRSEEWYDWQKKILDMTTQISSKSNLPQLKHDYNMLTKKEDVDNIDSTDKQVSKIKEIQNELHRLNEIDKKRLSTLQKGTKEYDSLLSTINGRSEEWWTWQKKITDETNKSKQEIASIEDSIKRLEDSQKNLNNLIDKTVELIKKNKELYKDQLNDKKESLKLAKSEIDLQKELQGLNKDRSDLEEELLQLKLDKSGNNNARILELESKLADNKKKINDKLEDDAYNKKVNALDKEIDTVDDYLSKEGKIRKDAMDKVNNAFRSGNKELLNELIAFNNEYGTSIESDITNMWSKAQIALEDFAGALNTLDINSTLSKMSEKLIELQMALNSAKWHVVDTKKEKDSLHKANEVLGRQIDSKYDSHTGKWSGKKFANGGRVNKATEAIVGEGRYPETIINDKQMPGFLDKALQVAMPNIDFSKFEGGDYSSTVGDVIINMYGSVDSQERVNSIANKVAKVLKDTGAKRGNRPISIL